MPFLLVYIAGGVIYSLLKWTFKIYKLRRLVTGLKDKPNRYDVDTIDTVAKQRNRITGELFGKYQEYPPKAANNKGWLFFWAIFWPINLVWTMFADVAKEIFIWFYDMFGGLLDRIGKAILPE